MEGQPSHVFEACPLAPDLHLGLRRADDAPALALGPESSALLAEGHGDLTPGLVVGGGDGRGLEEQGLQLLRDLHRSVHRVGVFLQRT